MQEYSVYEVGENKTYQQLFLELPAKLYDQDELTQDLKTEREILEGKHILSHHFKVTAFIVLDKNGQIIARALVTIYPDETTAFVGFFECINEKKAALAIFEQVECFCKAGGYTKIVGPVDASIWIKYRLKTNHFTHPYSGEPYNKPYYQDLFIAAGYEVQTVYQSNQFGKINKCYSEQKFEMRLKEMQEKGYIIRSIKKKEFKEALAAVYDLIAILYADFPAYKPIEKKEFIQLFTGLRNILDYRMVKLAYYKGEVVGFFISVPNYGVAGCGRLTLKKLINLLRTKYNPSSYVMLYMGVAKTHQGLGSALSQSIKEELQALGKPSIGALMKKGKVNTCYFKRLVEFEYNYILFERNMKN